MYVKPRYLWLIIPACALLFFLGNSLGKSLDKQAVTIFPSQATLLPNESVNKARHDLKNWLTPILTDKNSTSFGVKIQQESFVGSFKEEYFQLSGTFHGKKLYMNRNEKGSSLVIDNKPQPLYLLPYALYTPYEHAKLLRDQLDVVVPNRKISRDEEGVEGYQFTLPPEKLKDLLGVWLGNSFIQGMNLEELSATTSIQYQLWYQEQEKKLIRMVVKLKVKSNHGVKQDQLVFNF